MQLKGQIGVVLIKTGCEWPSIWSFYSPSSLSKKDSVILAAYDLSEENTFSFVMISSSSKLTWKRISLVDALEKENLVESICMKTVFFFFASVCN